jgi:ERCC4-related helicase
MFLSGVFAGVLRKSLLPISLFDFFIFDECHHARGNSPLALACQHIARAKVYTRILGLTASPIVGNKVIARVHLIVLLLRSLLCDNCVGLSIHDGERS